MELFDDDYIYTFEYYNEKENWTRGEQMTTWNNTLQ
jgi:hypothetical protein